MLGTERVVKGRVFCGQGSRREREKEEKRRGKEKKRKKRIT